MVGGWVRGRRETEEREGGIRIGFWNVAKKRIDVFGKGWRNGR